MCQKPVVLFLVDPVLRALGDFFFRDCLLAIVSMTLVLRHIAQLTKGRLSLQVVDLSEDNFFSLIGDDCGTRDDLKLTDNCNPTSAEAVRELLKTAEANGERVVVCIFNCILIHYIN